MELLSVKGVCQQLGISRWTVSKLVNTGQLKTIKLGKLYKFKQKDIDDYIESSRISVNQK